MEPVFQLPVASDSVFGSKEFGMGPSLVILTMPGSFVIGAVVNNIRTFGDKKEKRSAIESILIPSQLGANDQYKEEQKAARKG